MLVRSLAAGLVLVGGVVAFTAANRVDCSSALTPLQSAWTAGAKAGLATTLQAVPPASAQRVLDAFEGWAAKWGAQSRASCEATASGAQSERVEVLKRLCLERRLTFFSTVLTQAPTLTAGELKKVSEELPPVDCSDAELVATGAAEESEELRAKLQPLRLALVRVDALLVSGKRQAALDLALPTLEQARAVGFAPVTAETSLYVGQALRETDLLRSRAALQEAFTLIASMPSVTAWPARVGARAALDLLDTWSGDAAVFDALRVVAEAAGTRSVRDEEWEAQLHTTLGRALLTRGETKAAVEALRRSYELRLAKWGPEYERTQLSRANLAVALEDAGQADDAVAHFEALVELSRRLYGEHSLQLARTLGQLGAAEVVAVRYQTARAHLLAARTMFQSLGVPEAEDVVLIDNLASLAELSGDFEGARPLREQVLARVTEPPARAKYQALMSRVLFELKDVEGARRSATEARTVLSAINPKHGDLLVALTTLGRLTPGDEGVRLLEAALALPDARDPEYRGDALSALALHATGAKRADWLKRALESYREGEVAFRVAQLEALVP